MYFIIGGDGKQYGPVSGEDLHKWIAEGRLNAQTHAVAEGETEWRPLSAFPEFADALQSQLPIAPLSSPASSGAGVDFLERDYELDLGGCISRGWELVKNNMSVFLLGALIYLLIEIAIGAFTNIPFIGPVFSIGNFVIAGPFMGGIFYLFIRGVRGEPAQVGDIFEGFKRAFGQLFLATLVQTILIGLCLLPFIIVLVVKFISLGVHLNQRGSPPSAETLAALKSVLLISLPVGLICLIPVIYLGVSWKFSLPLIMDKGLDFWSAMKTSFKMVNKHWWQVFGLIILIGLVNIAGLLACCVGLVFTIPIGFAALMFAYETIFGARQD